MSGPGSRQPVRILVLVLESLRLATRDRSLSASLVVQTSFLGDVVLTTPLLRRLAGRGPVTVVVTPAAAPLLAQHPAVSQLVVYDKRERDAGVSGLRRVARLVAARGPADVACLAQGSHRSGALARLAGYRERVGFATSAGRLWYTRRLELPAGMHHAERLWRLAGDDAVPQPDEIRPSLHPSPADEASVDALLARHGQTEAPLIALAPGSVWATKRWPWFPDLAITLGALGRPVIIGARDDASVAAEIMSARPDAINATGQLPLLASAALLKRCRVLVTNDSLPLHLASAMNTPTVAVFGPTVPAFGFGPLATQHAVAGLEGLPCRPCHAHGPMRCPLGHFRCMRDLLPDEVRAVVTRVSA